MPLTSCLRRRSPPSWSASTVSSSSSLNLGGEHLAYLYPSLPRDKQIDYDRPAKVTLPPLFYTYKKGRRMLEDTQRPTVWVPNKGALDYSSAEAFGNIVYLTEGYIDRFQTGVLYRTLAERLDHASQHDYWMITSFTVINAIGVAILARKFGVINFLLWKEHGYVERQIMIDNLLTIDEPA